MQARIKRILLIGGILVLAFLSGGYGKLLAAEPSKAAWQAEWEKTVKAAEQEGQLSFYSNGGTDGTLVDFQKRFPNIKVVLAPGRGGQVVLRLMAERRGGKYIADVIKVGTGSAERTGAIRAFSRSAGFSMTVNDARLMPTVATHPAAMIHGFAIGPYVSMPSAKNMG